MRLGAELRGEEVLLHAHDEHHRKLQAFSGMNRHQRHPLRRVCQVLVLVGLKAHLAEEVRHGREIDAFARALLHKLVDGVEQFLYVLRTVDTFLCAVHRQGCHHAGYPQYALGESESIHHLALVVKTIYHLCESLQFLGRGSTHLQARLFRMTHHIHIAAVVLDGIGGHFLHGRIPDTPSREADDAQQRFVVPQVDRQTQIAERVFDLLALVERGAAIDAVGDVQFAQLALYHTALSVGPV